MLKKIPFFSVINKIKSDNQEKTCENKYLICTHMGIQIGCLYAHVLAHNQNSISGNNWYYVASILKKYYKKLKY